MDKATAQTHLDAWVAADMACSNGQSYSIDGRQLTRADGRFIREQISYWQRVVNAYTVTSAGGSSVASTANFNR